MQRELRTAFVVRFVRAKTTPHHQLFADTAKREHCCAVGIFNGAGRDHVSSVSVRVTRSSSEPYSLDVVSPPSDSSAVDRTAWLPASW